jgi:mannonate dehydratase
LLQQVGVDEVVSLLEHGEVGSRNWLSVESQKIDGFTVSPVTDQDGCYSWDFAPLQRLKNAYEAVGLTVAVIEDNPPMDRIRLGLPGRDEEIEWFCNLLRNMGLLGIPVLSYSFMSVFDWMRTATTETSRGGALVTSYDHALMSEAPLTPAGVVTEDRMWENFEYFLKHVVPVAEEARVRLALHPDDPPITPVRGLARIMCTLEALQRAIDLLPSDFNGLTFCQGTMTLMTDDLPATIRRIGKQGKIFYVHFRDVRGTPEKFVETFQDEGQTDMFACVRAYQQTGFTGVMRPDHVPTLEGDSNERPGYSTLGRLFAIGYMRGLREAAFAARQ